MSRERFSVFLEHSPGLQGTVKKIKSLLSWKRRMEGPGTRYTSATAEWTVGPRTLVVPAET